MRFTDSHFVEQRQKILDAKRSTLERHFPEEQIWKFCKTYGAGTGQSFTDAFCSKREKMSAAFDLFLATLEPDSSLEDVVLEAGRAFEYAHEGKDTFNIDVWVIADFLMGLQLDCLSSKSQEQIAELIGSRIGKWLESHSSSPKPG